MNTDLDTHAIPRPATPPLPKSPRRLLTFLIVLLVILAASTAFAISATFSASSGRSKAKKDLATAVADAARVETDLQARLAAASKQSASFATTRRLEVDEAVTLYADAANALTKSASTGGNLEATLRQYESAAKGMHDFSSLLSHLDTGLPSDLVQENVQDADQSVSGLGAAIACFENVSPLTPNPCAAEGSLLLADATQASTAFKDLVPYGSRSNAQVSALFYTPPTSV